MTDARPPVSAESLLRDRSWVRALARSLVIDESRADDVEQQTWLAAIENGPRDDGTPRAWLGTVVRNWARRLHRSEGRRSRHELAAARPESASMDDLVAQAEAQRRVAAAVLALAEPYRGTILLRFFEDLPPRAIAARQGVPVETVKTRLKRGLAELRRRLDDDHGGERRAWCVALLPLARGGTIMKASTKAALVAAAVVVLGIAGAATSSMWIGTQRHADESDTASARAVAAPSPREAPADARVARDEAADPNLGEVAVEVKSSKGDAIAGARIECYPAGDIGWMANTWTVTRGYRETPAPAVSALTDASGRARLPKLAAGKWVVVASKAGHVRSGSRVEVHSGNSPDPLDLRLDDGTPLSGRVLDRDGRPVAGARLLASDIEQLAWTDGPALLPRTLSDAGGRFTFEGLAAGERSIWVAPSGSLPGCAGLFRLPFAGELELRLDGNVVSGIVTEEPGGAPLAGVRVAANCTTFSGNRLGSWVAETMSNADGRFELDTVFRAGVGGVVAEKAGYVEARNQTAAQSSYLRFGLTGRATCDLAMRRGAKLSGVVTGPDGVVAGAQVAALWHSSTGTTQEMTKSSETGRYEFAAVPEGPVIVRAKADGLYQEGIAADALQRLMRGESCEGSVQAPASGEFTRDIELRRGAVIQGTVTDSHGAPLAGASVRDTSTDAKGRFRAAGIPPAASIKLTVQKDGFVTATEPVDLANASDVRVLLRPAPHVTGRVTDADGKPARGAWVQVVTRDDLEKYRYSDLWKSATRHAVRDDGSYDVALAVDEASVYVNAGGTGWQTLRTRDAANLSRGDATCVVDIVLQRGAAIEGRVVTGSDPRGVAGAVIRVGPVPGGPPRDEDVPGVAAITGADGSFRVDGAPPGASMLWADADGFVRTKLQVSVPSEAPLVVTLGSGLEISGRVELADGSPVAAVNVILRREGAPRGNDNWFSGGETGADGLFRARGLAAGSYVLSASGGWAKGNIRPLTMSGVAAGTADLRVVVEEGGVIAGRLRGADGRPVRAARVCAVAPPATGGGQAETGPDGAFRMPNLTAGAHSVWATPPQPDTDGAVASGVVYLGVRRDGVVPGTLDLELVLPVGEKIDGTLSGADGAPLANVWVAALITDYRGLDLHLLASSLPLGAKTDAAGRFFVTGLWPGRYRLVQMLDADKGRGKPLDLDGGSDVAAGSTGVSLVAGALPKIAGVVVDEDDRPVGDARVAATRIDGGGDLAVTSAADGTFVLDGAARGASYAFLVRRQGFAPARIDGVASGASGLRVRLLKGLTAAGRIVDAAGNAVAGLELVFSHESFGELTVTKTDADGRFAAEHLSSGSYRVVAQFRQDGKPCVERPCGVVRAGETEAVLRMGE